MTDLATILKTEGIVIRLIPMTTTSRYAYQEGRKLSATETIVERDGRTMVESVKHNSYGGKYLVTFKRDQGAQLHFSLKHDGVGDTIEEAYADKLSKGVVMG